MHLPVIPESAPFTPEQRAYLNGFLAGLFSHVPVNGPASAPPASRPLSPLSVLFGSQTGTSEKLAKRVAKEAGKLGFAPTLHDLAQYPVERFSQEQNVLIVTSTYGDGEPPDNAKTFWDFLQSDTAPKLERLRYSILALGDSNYAQFCGFGKAVDSRLEGLGAKRVHPRQDCDVDYETPFQQWLSQAVNALAGSCTAPTPANGPTADQQPEEPEDLYSRTHPYPARLVTNLRLSGPSSAKEVRHFEIALDDPKLTYEVGDALGVVPTNCPAQVTALLQALGFDGEESVSGKEGKTVPLRFALVHDYDITRIPQPLLVAMASKTGDAVLKKLTSPDANGELTRFLWGREIIDLLLEHSSAKFLPTEFIGLLKKLQPRLYSISSSPKAHPGQVHLTVGIVRYETLGRSRAGVCSTFLAERVSAEARVPVFVHRNPAFRPPPPDRPLIMVGPGTGIAPFRAFLEERRSIGATGSNWLFFGDQRAASDYLYREEIEAFQKEGLLARLDLAWSRDQEQKVYVQHRMTEQSSTLFDWLEKGAAFCVCGDASRMAKDVDAALHEVIEKSGGKTSEQALDYVKRLKAEKRYLRDVY